MVMEGSVLLSSPVFQSSAPNILRQLHRDQDFIDVTLVSADHQQIGAHKVILSSASPFFRELLVRHSHPAPLLYLKGIQAQELKHLLEFIYLGTTRIQGGLLDAFLEAGEGLQIKGLAKGLGEPIEFIQEGLGVGGLSEGQFEVDIEELKTRPVIGQVSEFVSEHLDKNDLEIKQEKIVKLNIEEKEQRPREQDGTAEYPVIDTLDSNFHKEMDSLWAKKREFESNVTKTIPLSFSELVAPKITTKPYSSTTPAIYQCDMCTCKFQKEDFLKIHITNKHSGLPQPVRKVRKPRSDQFVFKKN